MKTLPFLLSALLLTAVLPATAQQMNYQGRLTDNSGNPLADGQYTLEFSLWDTATSGTQVWGPFVLDGTAGNGRGPRADLVNGRFNAVLGPLDTTGRPLTNAFSNTPRYLQIKVGSNAAITPRQAILDTPTAMMAQRIPNVFTAGKNVGIGTDSPGGLLTLFSATNEGERLRLAGQEFYQAGNTSTDGISLLLGVNRGAGNRQLWIADSSLLTRNATNSVIRFIPGSNLATIDSVATDGTTGLPLSINPLGGNVGIGTSTPGGKFDVSGQVKSTGSAAEFSFDNRNNLSQRYVWYADNGGAKLWHTVNGDRFTIDANAYANIPGGASIANTLNVNVSYTDVALSVKGTASRPIVFQMDSPGNGYFQYLSYGLDLSHGNAYKPGGGSWGVFSDARLKKEVRDLTGALDKLARLHSVTFEYKQPEKFGVKGRQIGFIAQEVEKVFPEWIDEIAAPRGGATKGVETDSGEKFKTVNVKGFESLTVQALRELRAEKDTQIKTLSDDNTALRDTVKAQEARLGVQEKNLAALEKQNAALKAQVEAQAKAQAAREAKDKAQDEKLTALAALIEKRSSPSTAGVTAGR
jgi:hypothetical protein